MSTSSTPNRPHTIADGGLNQLVVLQSLKCILIALFLLFLVSCGGAGTSPSELPSEDKESKPLEVAGGTLNYSDRIGASFMLVFDFAAPPPGEGVEVQIFGPRGWNGGEPVRRVFLYKEAGKHVTWASVFRDGDGNRMEAVSGSYAIQAEINGQNQRIETEIDTDDLLPKPGSLTLDEASTTDVSLTWDEVPGAQSYLVELFETETGKLNEAAYSYTTAPSATLSDLDLVAGAEYRVGVTAFLADFTIETWQLYLRGSSTPLS